MIKKPSLKGLKNVGYLGHFAKDKWISKGHNDVDCSKVKNLQLKDECERRQKAKAEESWDPDGAKKKFADSLKGSL